MLQFLLNMENTPIRIDQPSRDSRIVDLIFRAQKSCGIYLLILRQFYFMIQLEYHCNYLFLSRRNDEWNSSRMQIGRGVQSRKIPISN